MRKFFRYFTLAVCLLFGPVVLGWIFLQGMTHLYWGILPSLILWLLLLAFWYLFCGQSRFRIRALRVGLGIAALTISIIGLTKLVRYEGSASGSSLPKLSWVWEEKAPATPSEIVVVASDSAAPESELEAAAGESRDFLGPGRDGMWETLPFGTDWNSSPPELLWRRPIGKAWSSFVVAAGKAITQEQVEDEERVACLNLFTGEELWHHADAEVRLLLERKENAGASMGGDGPRSTPVIHGNLVFTLGATGIVNCLELETGKLVWTANVIKDYGGALQNWGMANTPLVIDEHAIVIVPGGDKAGATLVAYDMTTGEERWVYQGKGAGYTSPRLMTIAGTEQIVSVNAKDVTGHDPATGEVYWKYDWPGHYPKVGQPQPVGADKLLMTASYGVGSPLIQVSNEGGKWSATELWKTIRLKTKFSSAVIHGGYAYGLDEGRLACLDLENGDKVWKNQKYGFGQQLLLEDWLLIQTEAGAVVIGRASPEGFEEEGRIEALSSMTWNVPAVAGRLLLVRNDKEAACYLLPPPASAAQAGLSRH